MAVTSVPQNTAAAPPERKRRNWLPLIMTLPATLAMIGILYPFGIAVYYSFTNIRIVSPTDYKFIGLQNYIRMVQNPNFWESLGNTLLFAVVALFFELILGFLLNAKCARYIMAIASRRNNFFSAVLIRDIYIQIVFSEVADHTNIKYSIILSKTKMVILKY